MYHHRQILIKPNFIPQQVCEKFVNNIRNRDFSLLEVFDENQTNVSGNVSWKQDLSVRNTYTTDISDYSDFTFQILKAAVEEHINPFYNIQLRSSEPVQLLKYIQGGHYQPHVDSEAIFFNNGVYEWRQNVNRDISIILYLNNEFSGGDLVFPDLGLKIVPQTGTLVAFPSTHEFKHGVEPIISGERFAMVTWAAINS